MKKTNRIVAAILCLLMIFLASCSDSGNSSLQSSPNGTATVNTPQALSLFFNAKDSLNPYAVTSEHNAKIQTLLYDPLVKLDPCFQPEFIIAENVEIAEKNCTVTLKNITFSDGSILTADDVVYSLKLAKESTLNYSVNLENVKSYSAADSKTVSITLSKQDPYFANLLTFPIIKKESEKRTDENKIVLAPIGSGRYVYDREARWLKANEAYYSGASPIKTINLIDAPDSEVVSYNLEANNVDIYTSDLSDGVISLMNGTVTLTPLNNLIYLGLNLERSILQSADMRYALSYAIDRTAICNDAYFSYASPANGLFHPLWEDAKGVQNMSATANLENSIANLNNLGYNNKDSEGFLLNANGKRIILSLVCNAENERRVGAADLIAKQMAAIGIEVRVSVLPWESYLKALTEGNFDLYIAEVNISDNMDITELVTSNGSLSYGIPNSAGSNTHENSSTSSTESKTDSTKETPDSNGPESTAESSEPSSTDEKEIDDYRINEMLDNAVSGFYKGENSIVDIINAFNAEMPVIPICYRNGIAVMKSGITNKNMSSVTDAYYNITKTTLN